MFLLFFYSELVYLICKIKKNKNMIHYSKLTRGLMPAKLYAYNDKTDMTISVYEDGENIDILNGDYLNNEHVSCSANEFMNALFTALEREHKSKQNV